MHSSIQHSNIQPLLRTSTFFFQLIGLQVIIGPRVRDSEAFF
jgi:hypothetical protein